MAACIALSVMLVGVNELWTHLKLSRLETAVKITAAAADERQRHAESLEKKTYEYIQKIEYLNAELQTIRTLAENQDAKLAEISVETDAARRDYQRVRSSSNGGTNK